MITGIVVTSAINGARRGDHLRQAARSQAEASSATDMETPSPFHPVTLIHCGRTRYRRWVNAIAIATGSTRVLAPGPAVPTGEAWEVTAAGSRSGGS